MFQLDPRAKVWLCLGATDMRKSVNGLSAMVSTALAMDPFSGHYFVFAGRTRRTIKVLYWDKNGYSLWYKRLEEDTFRWPHNDQQAKSVSAEQLQWLLSGLDWEKAHPKRRYSC